MRCVAAVLALLLSNLCLAEAPDDFAYGQPLLLEPGAPVYEVDLSAAVYRAVTRSDLGDVRVFDAETAVLPHRVQAVQQTQGPDAFAALPVFPLHTASDRQLGDLSLQVITRSDGTVLRLEREEAVDAPLVGYLLDATELALPMQALHLTLATDDADLLLQVRVDASDDLSRWRTVVPAATIARLAYGEHQLQQTVIQLPGLSSQYLRLTWSPGQTALPLLDTRARLHSPGIQLPRHWLSLSPRQVEDAVFHYETEGAFPINGLDLELPPNGLASVIVSSRSQPDQPWQPRHRGLHYRLRLAEGDLQNAVVDMSPVADRYWRVEIRDGGFAGPSPNLRLSWTPHRLTFLAAGEPPYLLAFGSATAPPRLAPLGSVLAAIQPEHQVTLRRAAELGERVVLGGQARLLPPAPGLPWRQWLLWAVLLAAVALLAAMAWRLARQLQR